LVCLTSVCFVVSAEILEHSKPRTRTHNVATMKILEVSKLHELEESNRYEGGCKSDTRLTDKTGQTMHFVHEHQQTGSREEPSSTTGGLFPSHPGGFSRERPLRSTPQHNNDLISSQQLGTAGTNTSPPVLNAAPSTQLDTEGSKTTVSSSSPTTPEASMDVEDNSRSSDITNNIIAKERFVLLSTVASTTATGTAISMDLFVVQKCWFSGPDWEPPEDSLVLFADIRAAEEYAAQVAYRYNNVLSSVVTNTVNATSARPVRTLLLQLKSRSPTTRPGVESGPAASTSSDGSSCFAFCSRGQLFWVRRVRANIVGTVSSPTSASCIQGGRHCYQASNGSGSDGDLQQQLKALCVVSCGIIGGTGNPKSPRGRERISECVAMLPPHPCPPCRQAAIHLVQSWLRVHYPESSSEPTKTTTPQHQHRGETVTRIVTVPVVTTSMGTAATGTSAWGPCATTAALTPTGPLPQQEEDEKRRLSSAGTSEYWWDHHHLVGDGDGDGNDTRMDVEGPDGTVTVVAAAAVPVPDNGSNKRLRTGG